MIWTNDGLLLIGHWGTHFSEIWTKKRRFSFTKMHLKMSSVKWRPFCFGLNVLSWAWLSWLGELWVRFSVYKIIYVIRMYNRNRKCVLKRWLVYHSPVPCLRTANIYVKKPVCIITVCILWFYLMKFICCYVICWINYAWVCVCCNDITLHECICVRRSKHAVLCPNWAGLDPYYRHRAQTGPVWAHYRMFIAVQEVSLLWNVTMRPLLREWLFYTKLGCVVRSWALSRYKDGLSNYG